MDGWLVCAARFEASHLSMECGQAIQYIQLIYVSVWKVVRLLQVNLYASLECGQADTDQSVYQSGMWSGYTG